MPQPGALRVLLFSASLQTDSLNSGGLTRRRGGGRVSILLLARLMRRGGVSAGCWRAGSSPFLAPSSAVSQSFSCVPAQHPQAIVLKNYVVRLVTASTADTLVANTRSRYDLPAVSASAVRIETDKKRCESAAKGYHEALHPGVPQVSRSVVVIKVGSSRYVVLDPAERAGEFQVHVVMDNHWETLAVFTG